MKWHTSKIEEIASVKGGKRLPKGHDFLSDPNEHLYIRARDIGNNRISLADAVYLTDDTFNKIRNYTVSTNDLVVTIVGANIGDVGFITSEYDGANLTENAARIRADEKSCDPRFLSFQISTPRAKEKFQLLTGGSAQGKLGLYKINAFDVVLPPIAVQKRIASILSAYDDLIENNRRRIQLLEQAARLLYKEWFVHLRFPGHEHTKVIDGVPDGWEKKPLGGLLTLQRGFDLPVSKRKEGSFPIYASTGINGYHVEAKVKGSGVVTGRSGSLGTVMFVSGDFWPLNTTLWVKEFKLVGPHYAHHLLATMQLEQYNGGAAVPTLNRNDVHRIEVFRPPSMLLRLFEDQSHNIVKQTDALI